eukprot:scaffold996_cov409-Prasinococcus_capsulatus_cf.AAC.33
MEQPGRRFLLALLVCSIRDAALPVVTASIGDREPEYRRYRRQSKDAKAISHVCEQLRALRISAVYRCVASCLDTGCVQTPLFYEGARDSAHNGECEPACRERGIYEAELPFHIRLTGWGCDGDCKYRCMRIHTVQRQNKMLIPLKYYGKWPFLRLGGVQEPASVLASLVCLVCHIWGTEVCGRHRDSIDQSGIPLVPAGVCRFWKISEAASRLDGASCLGSSARFGLVSINTWIASAVFHARDTTGTERYDYFSANALIVFMIYAFFARALVVPMARISTSSLHTIWPIVQHADRVRLWLQLEGSEDNRGILSCPHVTYPYDVLPYNGQVMITASVAYSLGWLLWAYAARHPQAHVLFISTFFTWALTISLEVLNGTYASGPSNRGRTKFDATATAGAGLSAVDGDSGCTRPVASNHTAANCCVVAVRVRRLQVAVVTL